MTKQAKPCPDCVASENVADVSHVSRREFLKTGAVVAASASAWPVFAEAKDTKASTPESLVKTLYDSLSEEQRKPTCFDWNYVHPKMGLLRTRVANNWKITDPNINNPKNYTDDQRDIIKAIFEGLIQKDWHARIYKQLDDDAGGFGEDQSFAIFGKPGDGKFEFVMTGRHMTIRCDGNSSDHVAFGGPIFYGHAAEGNFDEPADHKSNVFWHQAVAANKLYQMLDGKQRKQALIQMSPSEQASGFRPKSDIPGMRVSDMSSDQKEHMQKVLELLIEPYRQGDRDEVVQCLKSQGGLDACALSFYRDHVVRGPGGGRTVSADIGDDGVWDNWRLEGPAFVWYFRGNPHVHVWVNVADDTSVKINA